MWNQCPLDVDNILFKRQWPERVSATISVTLDKVQFWISNKEKRYCNCSSDQYCKVKLQKLVFEASALSLSMKLFHWFRKLHNTLSINLFILLESAGINFCYLQTRTLTSNSLSEEQLPKFSSSWHPKCLSTFYTAVLYHRKSLTA